MIHPKTEVRFIGEEIGYGVFATADIPEGTIVYVKDSLELVISPDDYLTHSEEMKAIIEKYSYIDETGNKIVSWDLAKYVNHHCHCNTMSTGYGFEIAIQDILKDEQITDEYGIFNLENEIPCSCGGLNCRKLIRPDDFDLYYQAWDAKIKKSIIKLFEVAQPLMSFVDLETLSELKKLHKNEDGYKSVYALKYHGIHRKKIRSFKKTA